MKREDCWCATYRKPCDYHEGMQEIDDDGFRSLPEALLSMNAYGCAGLLLAVLFSVTVWVIVTVIVFDLIGLT